MKEEIIANLKEMHHRHGMVFTSEQDAMDYYMDLVDLIEALIERKAQTP